VNRRDIIALLGSTAATWPLAAHAEQAAMPVIGLLHGARPDAYTPMMAAFRKSLIEAGYFEGQNVTIEFGWAEGRLERLPELTANLVRRDVSVIFAGGGAEPALAAKAATSKIPMNASRLAAVTSGMPWSIEAGMRCVPIRPFVLARQIVPLQDEMKDAFGHCLGHHDRTQQVAVAIEVDTFG